MKPESTAPLYLPLIGRLLIAAPFLLSGVGKLAAYDRVVGMITAAGLPLAPLGWVIAIVVEIGGGLLMIAGFRARIAAFVLAAFTLAAAVFFHRNFSDPNQMIHFLKNIVIIGGLLNIAYFGAGPLSLDNRNRPQALT
jgi:putative oxidoreductase